MKDNREKEAAKETKLSKAKFIVAIPENCGDQDGPADEIGSIPPSGRSQYDARNKSSDRERAARSQSKGHVLYKNQSQFNINQMGMEDKK